MRRQLDDSRLAVCDTPGGPQIRGQTSDWPLLRAGPDRNGSQTLYDVRSPIRADPMQRSSVPEMSALVQTKGRTAMNATLCQTCHREVSNLRIYGALTICEECYKSQLLFQAIPLLCDVSQLLDGWHNDGTAWTAHDESVRNRVSALQMRLQEWKETM